VGAAAAGETLRVPWLSPGWASAQVQTDGGEFTAETQLLDLAPPTITAVYVLGADGTPFGGVTMIAGDEGLRVLVHEDEALPDGLHVDARVLHLGAAGFVGRVICSACEPDTYHVVTYAVGGFREGSWGVTAPGLRVLATDAGPEAFLVRLADFESDLAADVCCWAGPRVAMNARYDMDVSHLLVGQYWGWPEVEEFQLGRYNLTVDGPSGRRECPCEFVDIPAMGPGHYTFSAAALGVGAGDSGQILLYGADVRLAGP
jgi:hypothetical protein